MLPDMQTFWYAVLALVVGILAGAMAMRSSVATRIAQLRADLAAERRVAAERAEQALRDEQRLSHTFAALSQQALQQASTSFLDLARAALGRHTAEARGDLDVRREAVDALVAPLRDSLDKVTLQLHELEASRRSAYVGLAEQVRGLADAQERLRTETSGLVTALRAPSVRGRWGELQLRRVVEMAGMVEHCDFVEQPQGCGNGDGAGDGAGRLRPDLVVRLPGGGSVVVDSKVPLEAYLRALEAPDETARRAAMAHHARQLRAHVDALARKAYWQQFQPAPELVVLFVPGEPLLSAALEHAPELYEHAVASSVLLATPTSLIGLLRTIGFGWRQEAVAAGAQAVCELGRQLHTRLGTMVDHVDRLGRSLESAVGAYNSTVGALESRVLVSARRFTELRISDEELPTPRHVDRAPRAVDGAALRVAGE